MYSLKSLLDEIVLVGVISVSAMALSNPATAQSVAVSEPASNAVAQVGQNSLAGDAVADEASAAASLAEVKGLMAAGMPGAEALSGTGFTYRHDWGNRKGQWKLNLNWGAVRRDSRVFVAIGECDPAGGKFIGGARYTLYNVAPNANRVSIWVNVDWSYPIRLCVDYLVVNP